MWRHRRHELCESNPQRQTVCYFDHDHHTLMTSVSAAAASTSRNGHDVQQPIATLAHRERLPLYAAPYYFARLGPRKCVC